MNRLVSVDMFVYVFVTFGQRLPDSQTVLEEREGLKRCVLVERFKQDHSHLPRCGGAGPVALINVQLRRDVISGT